MDNVVYLASDHAGFPLKQYLLDSLQDLSRHCVDIGPHCDDRCDYPDFAHALCSRILEKGGVGILICGTGIGMSMTANRHAGIRAALCTNEFHARACREHNNANVLCLGQRITAPALAADLVKIFLVTPFAEGRHCTRVNKIDKR
jgi:ribose 5-phosphate isomerase B